MSISVYTFVAMHPVETSKPGYGSSADQSFLNLFCYLVISRCNFTLIFCWILKLLYRKWFETLFKHGFDLLLWGNSVIALCSVFWSLTSGYYDVALYGWFWSVFTLNIRTLLFLATAALCWQHLVMKNNSAEPESMVHRSPFLRTIRLSRMIYEWHFAYDLFTMRLISIG